LNASTTASRSGLSVTAGRPVARVAGPTARIAFPGLAVQRMTLSQDVPIGADMPLRWADVANAVVPVVVVVPVHKRACPLAGVAEARQFPGRKAISCGTIDAALLDQGDAFALALAYQRVLELGECIHVRQRQVRHRRIFAGERKMLLRTRCVPMRYPIMKLPRNVRTDSMTFSDDALCTGHLTSG